MNYELCKKLKEAGFPQRLDGKGIFIDSEGNNSMMLSSQKVYVPTLSELIEACGEKFGCLTLEKSFIISERGKTWWKAGGGFFDWDSNMNICDESGTWEIECDGSTPEEATANLWLELNKKV